MINSERYMMICLKNEVEKFLAYKKEVEAFSDNSLKTYRQELQEAIKYMDIEYEDSLYRFNLIPYRLEISNKSKRTIAKKISVIRSFVSFLKDNGYIVKLIGDDMVKTHRALPKPIDFKYINEVLKNEKGEERLIILLLYGLGLRISELSNLKKSDIGERWIRVVGKGDKMRNIPLLPSIKDEIDKFLKENLNISYIFEKNGKKLSENSLRYKVNKIFNQIGIKVTPHQLRHSFASDLLNEGGRINDVSMLLGHSSLSTTQIYTKLGDGYKLNNYKMAHPLCKDMYGNDK